MNILMTTSETLPFSKSGGLADVVSSLSQALAGRGHNVKVFMPMYSFIDKKGFKKTTELSIDMLSGKEKAYTVEKKLSNVTYVGLVHPYFTERSGIYGENSFSPYSDNCPRFMFFTKACIAYIEESGFKPDVIHAHDWTVGMTPLFLKKKGLKIKSVFTIHNLAYQGIFSRYDSILSGNTMSELALWGEGENKQINMLKCGIESSDIVTTVSSTYAKEIQTEKYGCGLDWLLRARANSLYGITNGIDYNEWNPSSDQFFKEHYSVKSLKGKTKLKARIQEENGLEVNENIPLFVMISRLAEQKGFFELLLESEPSTLEKILERNKVQFLIIGTGDQRFVDKLKEIEKKYPDKLKVLIMFANTKAHEAEGAADFFLMPSRYEPCGLNQLYSLHYGTLPVAHKTGGLADTIIDIGENKEEGTGFLFDNLNDSEITQTVYKAIAFFEDKKAMDDARKRAMEKDFSWSHAAEEYEKLYKKLNNKNIGGNINEK